MFKFIEFFCIFSCSNDTWSFEKIGIICFLKKQIIGNFVVKLIDFIKKTQNSNIYYEYFTYDL